MSDSDDDRGQVFSWFFFLLGEQFQSRFGGSLSTCAYRSHFIVHLCRSGSPHSNRSEDEEQSDDETKGRGRSSGGGRGRQGSSSGKRRQQDDDEEEDEEEVDSEEEEEASHCICLLGC